jgi:anti-sigma factor RsiW
MNEEDLSRRLREGLPRYQAPPELVERIRSTLEAETPVNAGTRWPSWSRLVAMIVLVAMGSSAITTLAMQWRAPGPGVEEQVLSSHIRSLMPGHMTDVLSNDQHNVKPWFNGRVNLSPAVPRLDSAGFALTGGRIDYIEGRATASVVYMRREHVINVFAWAEPGHDIQATPGMKNGYHFIWERRDGVEIWIVSDLNVAELQDFSQRYAAAR